MRYVRREFSSVRWKMMKEDLGVSKAQAWGCARHPQEISKETQASKLGDTPVHPLLHQQSSVHPSPCYIFISMLASLVPCIALSHLESWCKLRRCIQNLGMIHSVIINLLISSS